MRMKVWIVIFFIVLSGCENAPLTVCYSNDQVKKDLADKYAFQARQSKTIVFNDLIFKAALIGHPGVIDWLCIDVGSDNGAPIREQANGLAWCHVAKRIFPKKAHIYEAVILHADPLDVNDRADKIVKKLCITDKSK